MKRFGTLMLLALGVLCLSGSVSLKSTDPFNGRLLPMVALSIREGLTYWK